MPIGFLPPNMRVLADGAESVEVEGTNVRAAIANLETAFPGMKARLCEGDSLQVGIAVVVDGSISSLGLLQPVRNESEIHFLPAIGGG